MQFNIKELKDITSKLNIAIEKSKINPKAGWIELISNEDKLELIVSNYDYYVAIKLNSNSGLCENIHATISSDTFIPLISKLDSDVVDINESGNALIVSTEKSAYTFPMIKEMGKTKVLDKIPFNYNTGYIINVKDEDLVSIAKSNTKGLLDSIFVKEIQQYICIDNIGAITFTENIYINNFKEPYGKEFKFLLNCTQSKLLDIFSGAGQVSLYANLDEHDSSYKIAMVSNSISVVFKVAPKKITDKYPVIRLREIANNVSNTHIILDKKILDKALSRLMVFDKKFDITDLTYSKIVFGLDSLKLVSIKSNNFEEIKYISSSNTFDREFIIRFADLVKQLKAITSKEIDISYGNQPALAINGNVLQLIPEVKMMGNV